MERPTMCVACLLLGMALAGAGGREALPQPAAGDEVSLPEPVRDGPVSLEAAIAARRSIREFADTPLTWEQIGQLAWAAQGITDPARGLRAAPSAGGCYPLELYFVTPQGLYRYLPDGHKLERLSAVDLRQDLGAAATAPLAIVITAVFERTARRFGDPAEKYAYLEVGHAAQNIHLQAVALGLVSVPIAGLNAARVTDSLALPPDHRPVYVIPVGCPRGSAAGE